MELKSMPAAHAAPPASRVAERLPPILYQTYIVNGQQDSSTLFEVRFTRLAGSVYCGIWRTAAEPSSV